MNNYLNVKEIVDGISPPEWIAITLAEYLETTAKDAAEQLAKCTEDIADENVDAFFDQAKNNVDHLKEVYSDALVAAARRDDIDLDTVDRTTQQFQAWAKTVWENDVDLRSDDWYLSLRPSEQAAYNREPYNVVITTDADSLINSAASTEAYLEDTLQELQAGHTTLIDLGTCYVDEIAMRKALIRQQQLNVTVDQVAGFIYPTNYAGQIVQWTDDMKSRLTIDSWVDYIGESAGSALALAGGLRASALDNVSDRLTYLDNYLKAAGTGMADKARGVVAGVRGKISDLANDATSMIQAVIDELGIKQIADGTMTSYESELYQYQGATPIPCININACKNILVASGAAVAIAGYAVFQAAKTGLTKLASWAKKAVESFTVPQDIDVVDSVLRTHRGFADNWMWTESMSSSESLLGSFPDFMSNASEDLKTMVVDDFRSTLQALWNAQGGLAFRSWGGEMTVSFQSIPSCARSGDTVYLVRNTTTNFKPACVDIDRLYSYLQNTRFSDMVQRASGSPYNRYVVRVSGAKEYLWSETEVMDFMNTMGSFFSDPHAFVTPVSDDPADKNDARVFQGWVAGWALHNMYLFTLAHVMSLRQSGMSAVAAGRSAGSMEVNMVVIPDIQHDLNLVTNADLIIAASGWNADPDTPIFGGYAGMLLANCLSADYKADLQAAIDGTYYSPSAYTSKVPTPKAMGDLLLAMLFDQRCDRAMSPNNWIYLPYSKSVVAFSTPDYQIRTDSDNIAIATALVVAAGAIIATVLATVAVKTIIRAMKRKSFFTWTAAQGRLDNKMWNGKSLTRTEKWVYLRANKKLNAVGKIEELTENAGTSAAKRALNLAKNQSSTIIPVVNGVMGTNIDPNIFANDPSDEQMGVSSGFQTIIHLIRG